MSNLILQQPLMLLVVLFALSLMLALSLPAKNIAFNRTLALSTSLLGLFIGVLSCLSFDKSSAGFQFLYRFDLMPQYGLSLSVGVDGLSLIFLLLTLFIFPVCFLAAWGVTKHTQQFFNYLLAMELLLILTFTTLDLFYFYVFFESLLIPMFIMIGVWGARERKIKAAYYFFLYTLFGSLVMLFGILYLYFIVGSTSYFVLLSTILEVDQQRLIWVCFFLAFAIKMPLFPFHIWLPEAHVEAPTVGSMLLASLLLKLGGYGFLRFSLSMLYEGSSHFAPLVTSCALLGVIYGSLSTVRQIDLKRIIAYSSVAHMNLVMLGLFSYSQQGVEGAIYLMVAHGVVSAGLFFCVGILYDRYHNRFFRYYGGLVTVMPLFTTALFIFTLANMSFPGTSNFLGELLLFLGVFAKNSTVLLLSTAGIVLSAVYSTWTFNRLTFGTMKTVYISRFSDVTRREAVILVTLIVAMIVLGLSSNFLLEFLGTPEVVFFTSSASRSRNRNWIDDAFSSAADSSLPDDIVKVVIRVSETGKVNTKVQGAPFDYSSISWLNGKSVAGPSNNERLAEAVEKLALVAKSQQGFHAWLFGTARKVHFDLYYVFNAKYLNAFNHKIRVYPKIERPTSISSDAHIDAYVLSKVRFATFEQFYADAANTSIQCATMRSPLALDLTRDELQVYLAQVARSRNNTSVNVDSFTDALLQFSRILRKALLSNRHNYYIDKLETPYTNTNADFLNYFNNSIASDRDPYEIQKIAKSLRHSAEDVAMLLDEPELATRLDALANRIDFESWLP